MKNVRSLICILCFFVALCFCSCGFFGKQKYVCEVDTVESVQIVELSEYVEEEFRFEYTVLADITDQTAFVERLNDLKHSVNWGDPQPMKEGYGVIKIDYLNGNFDLIHSNAQTFHESGTNHSGYFFFDKEQFDTLVSEYLAQENKAT